LIRQKHEGLVKLVFFAVLVKSLGILLINATDFMDFLLISSLRDEGVLLSSESR